MTTTTGAGDDPALQVRLYVGEQGPEFVAINEGDVVNAVDETDPAARLAGLTRRLHELGASPIEFASSPGPTTWTDLGCISEYVVIDNDRDNNMEFIFDDEGWRERVQAGLLDNLVSAINGGQIDPPGTTGHSDHVHVYLGGGGFFAPLSNRGVVVAVDDEERVDGDDEITATIEGRCACLCGRRIPDDSASAWFATEGCQRRWHRRKATDPAAVEGGLDADMLLELDAAAEQGPEERVDVIEAPAVASLDDILRGARPATGPTRLVIDPVPSTHPHHRLAYRRHCDNCQEWQQPRVYETEEPGRAPVLFAECGNCEEIIHGPVFVPAIEDDGRSVVLRLTLGTSGIAQPIPIRDIGEYLPGWRPQHVWNELERDLLEFHRTMYPGGPAPE